MYIGKLKTEDLQRLVLSKIKNSRSSTLKGPGIGLDVAYLELGDEIIAISSDPITGASKGIGSLALRVACNDVSAGGAQPLMAIMTLLLPPTILEEEIEEIMEDAQKMAEELEIDILGGHTEITTAVTRVIISTTVLGRVDEPLMGIQAGDAIVMTKSLGLEGTSIIVSEKEEIRALLTEHELQDAKDMANLLSISKEAEIGLRHGVHFMHDITEGGLVGALSEMVFEKGLGFYIDASQVTIHSVTKKVAAHYGIDPYQLISSGSLLLSLPEEEVDALLEELDRNGIEASWIGSFREDPRQIFLFEEEVELEPKSGDELYKVMG